MMTPVIVKTANGKRLAGYVNERGDYVTFRRPQHFFRKFLGFGISKSAIQRYLQVRNARGFSTSPDKAVVKIIYIGKKKRQVFVAKLSDFLNEGREYNDRGDVQIVLPIRKMMLVSESKIGGD